MNHSFGFEKGQLIEIRFDVDHPHGNATMRLRGIRVIKDTLAHIGAKSNDDVAYTYAMLDENNDGLLSFTGSNLATPEQASVAFEAYHIMAEHSKNHHTSSTPFILKRLEEIADITGDSWLENTVYLVREGHLTEASSQLVDPIEWVHHCSVFCDRSKYREDLLCEKMWEKYRNELHYIGRKLQVA